MRERKMQLGIFSGKIGKKCGEKSEKKEFFFFGRMGLGKETFLFYK